MSNHPVARFLDPDRSGSITQRYRVRRSEEFRRQFPDLADMRVLDLGGTAVSWRVTGLKAGHVTIVNLGSNPQPEENWMEYAVGDACVGGFGKFDLVYCNSVIEHVGGHARRQQLAEVIQESAPAYWVQTPNRYFPIEPHWLFPGFQQLPFALRVKVTQHWNAGHYPMVKDKQEAAALVASTELVSITEMLAYFPGCKIWAERFAGLVKSIVAYKSA